MTHHLHSKADNAWWDMYEHQLDYDQQLSAFLRDTEASLSNMRD